MLIFVDLEPTSINSDIFNLVPHLQYYTRIKIDKPHSRRVFPRCHLFPDTGIIAAHITIGIVTVGQ